MKRMFAFTTLFILLTFVVTVNCETKECFTLIDALNSLPKTPKLIQSMSVGSTLDFSKTYTSCIVANVPVRFKTTEYDRTIETEISYTFSDPSTCTDVHTFINAPKQEKAYAKAILESLMHENYYTVNYEFDYFLYPSKGRKWLAEFTSEDFLDNMETYLFKFPMLNMEMSLWNTEDGYYFIINRSIDVECKSIGSGISMGDTYQGIKNNENIKIISASDSNIICSAIIENNPANMKLQFDKNEKLISAYIVISGCYSLDDDSFEDIKKVLSTLYQVEAEYETDTSIGSIYTSFRSPNNTTPIVCIQEIKEEEGRVLHTLTFMYEEEYNLALFMNSLN